MSWQFGALRKPLGFQRKAQEFAFQLFLLVVSVKSKLSSAVSGRLLPYLSAGVGIPPTGVLGLVARKAAVTCLLAFAAHRQTPTAPTESPPSYCTSAVIHKVSRTGDELPQGNVAVAWLYAPGCRSLKLDRFLANDPNRMISVNQSEENSNQASNKCPCWKKSTWTATEVSETRLQVTMKGSVKTLVGLSTLIAVTTASIGGILPKITVRSDKPLEFVASSRGKLGNQPLFFHSNNYGIYDSNG